MGRSFSWGGWRRRFTDLVGLGRAQSRGGVRRRRPLQLEALEERTLLSAAPVAHDDSAVADATVPVLIHVLANDTAAAGLSLNLTTVTIVGGPSVGSASVNPATGDVTYTAPLNFFGNDAFTYTVKDSAGVVSNAATVNVLVTRPLANPDQFTTDRANPTTFNLLANDTAPPGLALNPTTVTIVTPPVHGTVAVDPKTGIITYTATAGFTGIDTFFYTVNDTDGVTSNQGKVSVYDNLPFASDDFATTNGSNPIVINLLDNDSPPPGLSLVPGTIQLVTQPAGGTATIDHATGQLTYTAFRVFSGTDRFTYKVQDSNGTFSNEAQVTILVNRPHASDDLASTDAGNPVVIPILSNDTDAPGLSLDPTSVTIQAGSGPSNGTLTQNPSDGSVTYTPRPGFVGKDTFQYVVSDTKLAPSNVATVTVMVTQPQAVDDTTSTNPDTPVVIPVLANDTDFEGAATLVQASVRVTDFATHGSTSVNPATGAITYTPNPGYLGPDTFRYTVADNGGAVSNKATVTVTVQQGAGLLKDDTATTEGTNAVHIPVLANDTAPGGFQVNTLKVVTPPGHGTTVVDTTNGIITYILTDSTFLGTDTFTYDVQDVSGNLLGPAIVAVTITAPTAGDDSAATLPGTPVVIPVLNNDSAPTGGTLVPSSVTVTSGPANGSTTVDPTTGAITYVPNQLFQGQDTFAYTVADAAGGVSSPATVTVLVSGPNAVNDFAGTAPGTPVTIDVLANDTDPNGPGQLDPASVKIDTQPSDGTITAIDPSTGKITYTPDPGFTGSDTFTYTVTDLAGFTSGDGTVTVTVSQPTAFNDAKSTTAGTPVAINVLSNDQDTAGPQALVPGSVTVTSGPGDGQATVDPSTGIVTYTPAANFVGTDQFTYTVADVNGAVSNNATVTVTVTHATGGNNGGGNNGGGTGGGITVPVIQVGSGSSKGQVAVFDPHTAALKFVLTPYGLDFTGGLRVALGDVNHDGVFDIIIAPAHANRAVLVFNGQTGATLARIRPKRLAQVKGVRVAAADVNGDGRADVLTLVGHGRKAVGQAFDGVSGALIGRLTRAAIDRFFGGA
jgi:hypothetical protein